MRFEFTVEELKRRHPELTDELLGTLREWADDHGLTALPPEKLALFAHSCRFDANLSLRCLENFYRMRSTIPEFFGNLDPDHERMQAALDTLCYVNLPATTPEGYRVVLHRLEDTRPEMYLMDDAIKMFLMMLELDLYVAGSTPGVLALFDAAGLRVTHLMRVSLTSVRKFIEYVQEAAPIRLKGIHVVNGVWFMNKVLALVRPFMKKELYDLIHIYSSDLTELYPVIPPECLPKDYGGELCSIENLRTQFRQSLHKWRDQFLEEEALQRCYKESPDSHRKSDKRKKEKSGS